MRVVTVIALGPGDEAYLTMGGMRAMQAAKRLILRTQVHGVAGWLASQSIAFEALDRLHEEAEDFGAFNALAAQYVFDAARQEGCCYAVPDPLTDQTVALLKTMAITLRVLPGVTEASATWAQAMASPLPADAKVCTMPALDLAAYAINPYLPLLLTEMGSRLLAGEVKIKLLELYAPQTQVLFEDRVIALDALDRQAKYDHQSAVYIPASPMTERLRYNFTDLLHVMARLRRQGDGCPWDIEQTHETLRQYMIEEAYELVEAVDQGDMDKVADELGDVLLQVVFHAQIAKEHGEFDIGDVTTAISHKMITRHAHIFGDIVCETPEDVLKSWEAIKKKEKGLKSTSEVMRDVPGYLPALMRASKVQNKAKQVGFDWQTALDALKKVEEETQEVKQDLLAQKDPQEEFGDLLFAAVNAIRLAGIQPELALSAATEKFIRRFTAMEAAIKQEGKQLDQMTLPQMDGYWDAVKHSEREAP